MELAVMDWDGLIKMVGTIVACFVGLGALAAGLGSAMGQFRRSQTGGDLGVLQLAEAQRDIYANENKRLHEELTVKVANEASLNTQIAALSKDKEELRALIMLDKIPKPLERFVISSLDEFATRITSKMEEILLEVKAGYKPEGDRPSGAARMEE